MDALQPTNMMGVEIQILEQIIEWKFNLEGRGAGAWFRS